MATERNKDHPGRYGSIVFTCDEVGCSEEHDTEYTTWEHARADMKREGWYIMMENIAPSTAHVRWNHYCPEHGKARYIAEQEAKPRQVADLPWLRKKS